jgi:hypothetical protein
MPGFMKTPQELELEQLQLIKNAQLIQNRDDRGGFFSNLGAPQLAQGQQAQSMQSMNPMANPMFRQQLMMQNMMNPNQMQGAANNTGLLLGQALTKAFGGKTPEQQMDPEQAESFYRTKGAQRYAQISQTGSTTRRCYEANC